MECHLFFHLGLFHFVLLEYFQSYIISAPWIKFLGGLKVLDFSLFFQVLLSFLEKKAVMKLEMLSLWDQLGPCPLKHKLRCHYLFTSHKLVFCHHHSVRAFSLFCQAILQQYFSNALVYFASASAYFLVVACVKHKPKENRGALNCWCNITKRSKNAEKSWVQ